MDCMPGRLVLKSRKIPSSGWMRNFRRLGCVPISSQTSSSHSTVWKRLIGGFLNSTMISVTRPGIRLPVRMKNGTPDHRQLSMRASTAANVSRRLFSGTRSSVR